MKPSKHPKSKRPRGRPAKPLPDPIQATPEEVARALFATLPKAKTDWKFLKKPKPS